MSDVTTGGGSMPERVRVSDCTLREGEQQPGIVLDGPSKMAIAELLGELGVTHAELGNPAVSTGERNAITELVAAGIIAHPIAVCRAHRPDIDMAAECGVRGVVISSPVSPWQLEHKLHSSIESVIEIALDAHNYAHEIGLVSYASAYDTFRTPWESIERIYGAIAEAACTDGLRVVDTVGIASPQQAGELVARVKDHFGLPVEVHFHDDFGLAMANTVAAVIAGADSVSTSIAGVGERAGNAATEEIVAALEFVYGVDTGLNLELLGPASRDIVRLLDIRLAPNKAVSGDAAFRHVAGLSAGGFLRSPLVAQPIEAERIGRRSEVVLGKMSGKASLASRVEALGLAPDDVDLPGLLESVKALSERKRGLVSDAELLRIVPDHWRTHKASPN